MDTADAEALDQVEAQARVQARGLEELLAEGAAELGHVGLQRGADAGDDGAHQRVAVGVQARGGHGDNDVAVGHALGAQQLGGIHDAGRGARDVVVVGFHDAGVLGSLAADEGRARGLAGPRDAGDDGGDALGDHVPAGDVVGHEDRARADHDDVVDDHADQVLADRVVHVHGLRDRDLRAHAVRGGREQRLLHAQQSRRVNHAGESAGRAQDGGVVGGGDGALHQLDGTVARSGVDASGRVVQGDVGHGWCLSRVALDEAVSGWSG